MSKLFQDSGYGEATPAHKMIVYLAVILGINPALYEAAKVDGAGRWMQTLHITLPGMAPIIVLLATLSIGNVLNAGFEQVFNLYSPIVYESGDMTNYGTGMDLAKDYIPLLELYEKKYLDFPPPNSPWGALNYDFGLELTGYMSRIAELPGETFPYRFYVNDPWFWQNPWWDYYDHEPHDIYGPLSVARMNADGALEMPGIVEILTIDTEKGELWADGPAEVIPHIQKAFREAPDEPGLLTWLYPFRELHEAVKEDNEASGRVFFHDWFVRCAINHGLPLNTVLGTNTFHAMSSEARRKLDSTILLVSAMWLDEARITDLADMICGGGKVLVYGDVRQPSLLELLNLQTTDDVGLEGDFALALSFEEDEVYGDKGERKLRHRADIGDGSLTVMLRNKEDVGARVAAFRQDRCYPSAGSAGKRMDGYVDFAEVYASRLRHIDEANKARSGFTIGPYLRFTTPEWFHHDRL